LSSSAIQEVSQVVDFNFTGAVAKADLMDASLVMQGTLMGSGRTLSDALRAVGKPDLGSW
jgi:hypothetical protein